MVAQLESHPTLDPVQKAKTLICALNLISRNLPLPPDVFNAVSSIYHSDDSLDHAEADALEAPSDKVSDGPGISGGGDLIMDLDDALVKQRPNCTSGIELTKSRENRLQSHIQHRLTELEELSSTRGEDLQTKCLLELYGLKLVELQSKVRSDVSSEYWLRMNCAYPDKKLFDWGMMRLRRPLYGVGDAFAMEADDQFRKKRDAEKTKLMTKIRRREKYK